MGIADDIILRSSDLAQKRVWWVQTWMDIARLVLPSESAMTAFNALIAGSSSLRNTGGMSGPASPQQVKSIYDNTGMWAVDRLAAGMESLVTPQSEKWHGLTIDDLHHDKTTEEENIYLERLRNFQFALRYDPRAGFIPSHQKAMRSCIAFGTGVIYTEQGDGRPRAGESDCVYRYQYCPLTECMLATNDLGNVDTNYRIRTYTVKQLVQKFGLNKVSPKVRGLYEKGSLDEAITVIHAVCPRMESGSYGLEQTVRGSAIASYYVEMDTKHLLGDSGFYEFPFHVYHWLQQDNGPYAESPVMLALSEIKSLQAMGKAELRAFAQWTDPALATVNDGVMNRPNLNPRAVNVGALGADGSFKVKPLITAQNPDFAEKVMDARRNGVKETLYVNLFQILIKEPEMTATQAMLRANEKGELLGPAGGKIQSALSGMADRELGILIRKGIFAPTSSLKPPPSLSGKSIGVRFTSPLDRMRRANEGVGITRLLEAVIPLAKAKPRVMDKFDEDRIVDNLQQIFGAPADSLVTEAVLKQRRDATDKKTQAAENLGAGAQAGEIAKDASIAGRNMGETAQQSPQIMDALSQILERVKGGVQANPQAPQQAVDGTNAVLSNFGKPPVQAGFPG